MKISDCLTKASRTPQPAKFCIRMLAEITQIKCDIHIPVPCLLSYISNLQEGRKISVQSAEAIYVDL